MVKITTLVEFEERMYNLVVWDYILITVVMTVLSAIRVSFRAWPNNIFVIIPDPLFARRIF